MMEVEIVGGTNATNNHSSGTVCRGIKPGPLLNGERLCINCSRFLVVRIGESVCHHFVRIQERNIFKICGGFILSTPILTLP